MGLRTYQAKRDFDKTPEPRGRAKRRRSDHLTFVIQKHAARRLHHDFRLELDGVLLSWAVPKGPPTEPGAKVLAVRTEDHPLEYGSFEGVIPAGEYGGGTVMLWDHGRWTPDGDAHTALARGKLDFRLDGERLRGRWTLTRMRGGRDAAKENWLLIKRHDREPGGQTADPGLDESVTTGRSMQQIAAGKGSTKPRRKRAPQDAPANSRSRRKARSQFDPSVATGARKARQPRALQPQLATLAQHAPSGDGWLHELKFDGYRMLAHVTHHRARLITRGGKDWTDRFPEIAAAVEALPLEQGILDGEIVVFGAGGISDFQALQNSLRGGRGKQVYCLFDLPHCAGYDLTGTPLAERKELLAHLLAEAPSDRLRFSEHVAGDGAGFLRHACELGLEGAVSKRADAGYQQARSKQWIKTKCLARQEFVVGGMTAPEGSRSGFGALLLGTYDARGELRFAGRVGTGFTRRSLAELSTKLGKLERNRPPFADPPTGADARGVRWLKPECVVEVAFTEWTNDGVLRHPSFLGVREDKDPRDVHREQPARAAVARAATPRTAAAQRPPPRERNTAPAGVRLTHPDRVLYPDLGITKAELAEYYVAVADRLLPHVVDRPLTVVRCPRGQGEKCFYQKHATQGLPDEIRAVTVREKDDTSEYLAIDDLPGLIALVQLGVLELHPWGSRADRLDRPDRIVIDLDPGPGVAWARVVAAANRMRELLAELGLQSWARTTGGKGLHVVIPIERRSDWSEVKQFSKDLVALLARSEPRGFVLTASKAARRGKIFLDYLRNDRGATTVASYSTRARPGAPVATPLAWSEVRPELDPAAFTIRTVPDRVAHAKVPWAGFDDVKQSLTRSVRAAVRR